MMSEPIKPALPSGEWTTAKGYVVEFGFTREDVRLLRESIEWGSPHEQALNNLADRIEALLPPEENSGE